MEVSGGFRLTTNNRMELIAAIKGLELLKKPCKVTLHSDSRYVVDAMAKGWALAWRRKDWWRKTVRVPNPDLWQRLLTLCETHEVEFLWVKGHAGDKENECCDRLSYAAIKQTNLPVDEGYENKPESVRPAMTQEGQPCWKCSTPVIKRPGRVKPKRDYYFEYDLYCSKCGATYTVEEAKRLVDRPSSLL
jgi:ribonuclease HI